MKKLAFVFGALIMGFMITSCGESAKDKLIKDVEAYFGAAEQQLATIDNAEAFLSFVQTMNDRSDLLGIIQENYQNLTEAEQTVVDSLVYDRATEYNHAEALKCTEFITPVVENYEAAVNRLYAQYQDGLSFDEESLNNFLDAYTAISAFGICENVEPAIMERLDPVLQKEDEISDMIVEALDELYPDEE